MPVARIQMPDGRVARLDVPEGTTPQQVEAFVQSNAASFSSLQTPAPMERPDPTGTTAENLLAGAGKAFSDIGRGVRQIGASTGVPQPGDVAPTWAETQRRMAARRVGIEAEEQEMRRLDAPLMGTGAGVVGNIAGNVALMAPAPGLSTYGGAGAVGALMGFLQPTAEGESRGLNTLIGGAAGAAGKFLGDRVSGGVRSVMDWMRGRGAQAAAQNVERDTALSAARRVGYAVPPSQAGGRASRALEGFSNKINIQQAASTRNQDVTNALARKAVGLPDDAPLNEATFNALRESAAAPYREVTALSRKAADALEGLKEARFEAKLHHAHYNRTADPKALKEARFFDGKAEDFERIIEGEAKAAGNPELVQKLKDARVLIAKSYTVENAVLEGTGNVNAAKIAQSLNKGAPLRDELRTIATFANKFPKAAQTPEKTGSVPPFTMTDVVLGLGGGYFDPTLLALGVARPAARNLALSRFVQGSLASPSYGPGRSMQLLSSMVDSAPFRRLAPATSAASALQDY